MAPSLTYQPVDGLGASVAGGVGAFVRSAARAALIEEAKTAQVETQARNNRAGLFGVRMMLFCIRIGRVFTLSIVRTTRTDDSLKV